jgi:hypothetical protein
MRVCRALFLATLASIIALAQASAQFGGGFPGMPGGPGMGGVPGGGGMPGMPGGGFGAPSEPPPACQQLLTLRTETQKNADAINAAGKRKAPPPEACKLFKTFLATENRMIKAIEDNGPQCGLPPEVAKQVKAGHVRAEQLATQICEVAARGGLPAAPSLSDALGVTSAVPETTGKRGTGTFDTLTGSSLAR